MPLFTNNLLSPSGLGYGLANDITVTGASTGNAPIIASAGSDTNISVQLSAKGTGAILLPSVAGQALQRVSGGLTTFQTVLQGSGGTGLETMGICAPAASNQMLVVGTQGSGSFFTNNGSVFGIVTQPVNTGTGDMFGLYLSPTTNANGAVANVYSQFLINYVGATAAVTNAYGLFVQSPIITAGGTITTAVGIDIVGMKVAGVTTGYSIFQNSAADINHFAGAFESATSTSAFTFQAGGTTSKIVTMTPVASGVNYVDVTSAVTTAAPKISSVGSDANIDLTLNPKGTGVVNTGYGTTAIGGGVAAVPGQIGGSGPATATQNSWLAIKIAGTTSFLPVWR